MAKYEVPAVDKAFQMLNLIAGSGHGLTQADLSGALQLPKTTVYRILNTLVSHNVVARSPINGQFRLGGQLAVLGARLARPDTRQSLIEAAAPVMQALAMELREAVKISVREGDTALTIHAVQSPSDYSLSVRIGHTVPLYTGGAGKLLLAFAPPEQIDRVVAGTLATLTPYTITDPAVLRDVLARIRKDGFATDNGELRAEFHAVAVPVCADGEVIAALSLPLIGAPSTTRALQLRDAALAAAARISAALGRDECDSPVAEDQ